MALHQVAALRAVIDEEDTMLGAVWISSTRPVGPKVGTEHLDTMPDDERRLPCRMVPLEVYRGEEPKEKHSFEPVVTLEDACRALGGTRLSKEFGQQEAEGPPAGKKAPKTSSGRRRCPTPQKARFRDKAAAGLELARIQRRGKDLSFDMQACYPCPCGKWHLTKRGRDA